MPKSQALLPMACLLGRSCYFAVASHTGLNWAIYHITHSHSISANKSHLTCSARKQMKRGDLAPDPKGVNSRFRATPAWELSGQTGRRNLPCDVGKADAKMTRLGQVSGFHTDFLDSPPNRGASCQAGQSNLPPRRTGLWFECKRLPCWEVNGSCNKRIENGSSLLGFCSFSLGVGCSDGVALLQAQYWSVAFGQMRLWIHTNALLLVSQHVPQLR